jgi:hypothetical protein
MESGVKRETNSCSINDVLPLEIGQSVSWPIVAYWRANGVRQRAEFKTFAAGDPRKYKLISDKDNFCVTITRTQ